MGPSRTGQPLIKAPAIKHSFIRVYIPPPPAWHTADRWENTPHLSDLIVALVLLQWIIHILQTMSFPAPHAGGQHCKHIHLSVVCPSHHALAGFIRRMLKAKWKVWTRIVTHTCKAMQRTPQSKACAGTAQTPGFGLRFNLDCFHQNHRHYMYYITPWCFYSKHHY